MIKLKIMIVLKLVGRCAADLDYRKAANAFQVK